MIREIVEEHLDLIFGGNASSQNLDEQNKNKGLTSSPGSSVGMLAGSDSSSVVSGMPELDDKSVTAIEDDGQDITTDPEDDAGAVSLSVDDAGVYSITIDENTTLSDLNTLVDGLSGLSQGAQNDLINSIDKIDILSTKDGLEAEFNFDDYTGEILDNPVMLAANMLEQVFNSDNPTLAAERINETFDTAFSDMFSTRMGGFTMEDHEGIETIIHLAETFAADLSVLDYYLDGLPINSMVNILLASDYSMPGFFADSFDPAQLAMRFDEINSTVERSMYQYGEQASTQFAQALMSVLEVGRQDTSLSDDPISFIQSSIVIDFIFEVTKAVSSSDVEPEVSIISNHIDLLKAAGPEVLQNYVEFIAHNFIQDANNPDYSGYSKFLLNNPINVTAIEGDGQDITTDPEDDAGSVSLSVDDEGVYSITIDANTTLSDLNTLVDGLSGLSQGAQNDLINSIDRIGILSTKEGIEAEFNADDYTGEILDNPVMLAANMLEQVFNSDNPTLAAERINGTFDTAFSDMFSDKMGNGFIIYDDHGVEAIIQLAEIFATDLSALDYYIDDLPINSMVNILQASDYSMPLSFDNKFDSYQFDIRANELESKLEWFMYKYGDMAAEDLEYALLTVLNVGTQDTSLSDDPISFMESSIVADFIHKAILVGGDSDISSKVNALAEHIYILQREGSERVQDYVEYIMDTYIQDINNPNYLGFFFSIYTPDPLIFDFTPHLRGLPSNTQLFDDGIV